MKSNKYNTIRWLLFFLCTMLSTLPQHPKVITAYLIKILDTKAAQAEGLVGNTLVKTVDGYIDIASIQNNDHIASFNNAQSTQAVILNQSIPVSYLFELQLAPTTNTASEALTIFAAPRQQFYDTVLHSWVCAKDLTADNCIGNLKVTSCRKVQKITHVYQLTTQDHIFKITPDDIVVHNANVATTGLPLLFGACSCVHPVVAVIGRTISLAKLAISVYQTYQDAQSRAQGLLAAMEEEEVVITIRSYYNTRKKELLTLLEQYRSLKQSVMALSDQATSVNFLLNAIVPAQIQQSLLPSLQSELSCTPKEKQKLLQLREQELTGIETEINSLQITLMLHLQDHADQLTSALAELDPAYNAVQQNLHCNTAYRTAAIHIATQTYTSLLTLLESIENLEQKIVVLQRLIQYYQHPTNALLLKNSTNVLAVCNQCQATLTQIQQFLPQCKKYALTSQQSAHQTLTQSGLLSQQTIISIQRNLQKNRQNSQKNHNANAKIKQSQISHATPPNDPDPEDDIDEKTYDDTKNDLAVNPNDIIHQFRNQPGHIPNTPANKQRVLELIRDIKNRKGKGDWQLMWYAKDEPDGQLWASVNMKTQRVKNCGLNKTPRLFSKGTGLNVSKTPKE